MSGFILKLIAAVTMLIDHAGLVLFPHAGWMRIVGRLAFPIFAFCIAEGFHYTRSRGKYFLRIFLLGVGCQLVYWFAAGDTLLGILIAFSVSILLMWLVDRTKTAFCKSESIRYLLAGLCVLALAATFLFCSVFTVDYGFFGILLPVWISLFDDRRYRLAAFTLGLLALCAAEGGVTRQWWCLGTVPILALYNGKPGRYRMKYFFYVFYPAHLAILQLIAWAR